MSPPNPNWRNPQVSNVSSNKCPPLSTIMSKDVEGGKSVCNKNVWAFLRENDDDINISGNTLKKHKLLDSTIDHGVPTAPTLWDMERPMSSSSIIEATAPVQKFNRQQSKTTRKNNTKDASCFYVDMPHQEEQGNNFRELEFHPLPSDKAVLQPTLSKLSNSHPRQINAHIGWEQQVDQHSLMDMSSSTVLRGVNSWLSTYSHPSTVSSQPRVERVCAS